jgi:hypothetical protein
MSAAPPLEEVAAAVDLAMAETFEQIAFRQSRRQGPAPLAEPVADRRCTVVPLVEPWPGWLALLCSTGLTGEITATLFGEAEPAPPPDREAREKDALAELANTVAGAVLAHLAAADRAIRVGLPEAAPPPPGHPGGVLRYELDDGEEVEVRFSFSSPPPTM